jgi:hypothetical protein
MTWGHDYGGKEAVTQKVGHRGPPNQHMADLCFHRTLRDLHRSVAAGRPISLPNVLRLCKRRLAVSGVTQIEKVVKKLKTFYLRRQPFRTTQNRSDQ